MSSSEDASLESYFHSYNDLSIHELMLKDRSRTLAYRNFFESNCDLVKDKVVMDVGATMGILSLFAASAGARKVLAVEASSFASLCKEIVHENQLDHIVEVIHGPVETISLPAGIHHVDIIISEWMGFYLLHESMLESVIVARDRFLASDGILLPSVASLWFSPVDMTNHFQDRAEEWSNIYGFDFSPVASQINLKEVSKPLITSLNPSVLCSEPQKVVDINLKTVTPKELSRISAILKFPMKDDSKVYAFAAWFDVEFHRGPHSSVDVSTPSGHGLSVGVNERGDACSSQSSQLNCCSRNSRDTCHQETSKVVLKTGPHDPPMDWKQTVIFLPRTILVEKGINLCCRVTLTQDSLNRRHYNISVTLVDENDSDDEDDDDKGSDVSDSDDLSDHPVPCLCGADRCRIIAALVDKYDEEHRELGHEAEMVEHEAEVAAARQLDADIEKDGWQVDSNVSGVSMDDKGDDSGGNVCP